MIPSLIHFLIRCIDFKRRQRLVVFKRNSHAGQVFKNHKPPEIVDNHDHQRLVQARDSDLDGGNVEYLCQDLFRQLAETYVKTVTKYANQFRNDF